MRKTFEMTHTAEEIVTRTVEYVSEGRTMYGHLARPPSTLRCPAVLIGHEGAGLNDVQRQRANRLAQLGYIAFAIDYHAGHWYSDPAAMMEHLGPLLANPDRCRAVGGTALDVLLREPQADPSQVAAIGYGAGGTIALELGRSGAALKAIAAVNPVLDAGRPEETVNIVCPVLVCVGSNDPLSPQSTRNAFAEEMDAARIDWQLLIHGGAEHAFHLPPLLPDGTLAGEDDSPVTTPGIRYSPAHARRSWRAIVEMLDECLDLPQA